MTDRYGRQALDTAEKQLHLFHMDEEWEFHLRVLEDIREGIHLLRWGGAIPLEEFHRKTFAAFEELEIKTEEKILASFDRVKISDGGIDMEGEGLTRPTSTWTYIINDNPFGGLGLALLSSRNIGMAAGAPIVAMMFSPIISILLLIRKWFSPKKKGNSSH